MTNWPARCGTGVAGCNCSCEVELPMHDPTLVIPAHDPTDAAATFLPHWSPETALACFGMQLQTVSRRVSYSLTCCS